MNDYCPGAVQEPQDGGGGLNTGLPARAVWHITWDALNTAGGQPDPGAVSGYLERVAYCPHLFWNPFTGEMIQYYPASQSARALAAWNEDGAACIQIEVFFTPGCIVNGIRYETVADTPLIGLDTILQWLDSNGIPRVWPMGSPQWQGNSRDPGIWNTQAGHYGHCNVPDNTHTDPGPMPDITATHSEGNDMGILEGITEPAMQNLRGMVVDAVEAATANIQKSVAFQEQFSVKMLEEIASKTGVTVDSAAIAADIRAQLAAQIAGPAK